MDCSQCNGEGVETYEEDGRMVTDACYHCGNTGQVDEETDFLDRLKGVATTLAEEEERQYRTWREDDPDGDGYDLCAAENGMSAGDYYRSNVWDRAYTIQDKLIAMSRADQELLVAWNAMPYEKSAWIAGTLSIPDERNSSEDIGYVNTFNQEDDIPF